MHNDEYSRYDYARWSGIALLVGGILLIVSIILTPNMFANPSVMATNTWSVLHVVMGIGLLLVLFGLIGWYSWHAWYHWEAPRIGWIGLVGFILLFIGTALFMASTLLMEGLVVPVLAQPNAQAGAAPLLTPMGALYSGNIHLGYYIVAGLTFAIGGILMGLATYLADALEPWPGALVLIGAPLLALSFIYSAGYVLGIIGAVLVGAGFIWIGYVLLTREHLPVRVHTRTEERVRVE